MAVTYVGTGGAQTGTTSLTITGFASGLEATDVLMMWAHHKGTLNPSGSTGWTRVKSVGIGGVSSSLHIYWKVAGGTSHANVTLTDLTSSSVGSMAAFRGVDNTNPLALSSAPDDFKEQVNGEGTYVVSSSGALWTRTTGDMAVGVIGLDNDATIAISQWRDSAGSALGTGLDIASGSTTTGTDCSGAWARKPYAVGEGDGTIAGVDFSVTEGSAGTASNSCALLVLAPASTAPTSAPPQRTLRGEPVMGPIPRPRRRRAG